MHAIKATLVGLATPLELAGGAGAGQPVTVAVPVVTDLGMAPLSLSATIAAPTPSTPRFWVARFVAWGLGGALFVFFLMRLLRGNSRR